MTAPSSLEASENSVVAQFTERAARLARRVRSDTPHRWMLIAGGILVPAGILLIILGWVGASHTILLFEQLPYVVSGGLGGLALVVLGGFVYFAYWQTVALREARERDREIVDALCEIRDLLAK
jgi:4-amino-4-deoxy-L-arabinose transferase-like glycosyltransferase